MERKIKIKFASVVSRLIPFTVKFRKLILVLADIDHLLIFHSIDKTIDHLIQIEKKKLIPEMEKLRFKMEDDKRKRVIALLNNNVIEFNSLDELYKPHHDVNFKVKSIVVQVQN